MTHLGALCRLLPERDPHPQIHAALEEVLGCLIDARRAGPLVVRFELQLLSELGFGLDLESCAATGATDRAGLCVAEAAGARCRAPPASPGRTSCCALPAFLGAAGPAPSADELADGFAVTGFFLARHVFEPRGLALPDARGSFVNAILSVYSGAVAVS